MRYNMITLINYDLIAKIEMANGQFKLYKDFNAKKKNIILSIILSNGLVATIMPLSFGKISFLTIILLSYFFEGLSVTNKIHGDEKQANSICDLNIILKELNKYHDISMEQLMRAKVYYRKINFLSLEEYKYISIPTNNIYNEREVSLLQEHRIGSSKYVLRIENSSKVLKLSYNSI
ncbi:MAG: hypothetical protein PHE54_01925 [Bacilli bacterium]|nr:hypothetical protein [Bacilli bacterium]